MLLIKRNRDLILVISAFLGTTPLQNPVHAGEKTIIAHRGASGYVPEHTLEAVAMAHAFGADFIEQDVVLSKDHVPVVLHDIDLEPVTDVATKFPIRKRADGKYYAIDFTLAELKSLNVHERVDPKSGNAFLTNRFPANRGQFQIPTLEEELQLIQGMNHSRLKSIGIYPEIKSPGFHRNAGVDISKIVLEVLKKYGYSTKQDLCIVQCFDWSELKQIRKLGYQGRLVFLMGGRRMKLDETSEPVDFNETTMREIAKVADGIGPALQLVADQKYKPTNLVADAHKAGLIVHPYTIRTDMKRPGDTNPANMFKVILDDAGADGVFTDQPDAGVNWKNSRTK